MIIFLITTRFLTRQDKISIRFYKAVNKCFKNSIIKVNEQRKRGNLFFESYLFIQKSKISELFFIGDYLKDGY